LSDDRRFDDERGDAAAKALPYTACADVRVSAGSNGAGEKQYFLKSAAGEVFIFREQEHFLWQLLDGRNSAEAIATSFLARFGLKLGFAQLFGFVDELIDSSLVERAAGPAPEPADSVRRINLIYSRERAVDSAEREAALGDAIAVTPTRPREPMTFYLFNPERLLGALAAVFWIFRRLVWLLFPFAFFAFLIIIHNLPEYEMHLRALLAGLPFWGALFASELVLNLLVRITQGVVIRGFGGNVRHFRLKLSSGFWPRFVIDESAVHLLPRRARLWVHASPLLIRLTAFAVGTTVWGIYRQTDTVIAEVGLGFGLLGLWSFNFCAFPLLPLDGYRWLATAIDQPDLLGRAFRYLGLRVKGRAAPEAMSSFERWGLALFAAGTLIWFAIVLMSLTAALVPAIIDQWQGLGFVVILSLFCVAAFYITAIRRLGRQRDALHRSERAAQARRLAIGLEPRPGN
jgi:putative peptide zinc metalloprotease protein